jgi:hypothetical protein
MKTSRMVMLSCCLLATLGLAIPALARTPAPTATQMSTQNVTINGTVSAVSDTSVTVVDSEKMELIVTIDAKTKITKAGKAAKAADLKANDVIVVVATKGEGKDLKAITIEVS